MKFKRFIKYIVFFLLSLSFGIMSLNTCYAEGSKAGVCKSPYLEVTRHKWEGNKWNKVRDSDSKTFKIEDITFNVSLIAKGVTITADGTKLVYIDYSKYQSNLQDHSKSRRSHYSTFYNVQGKKVMVRILNFAPEQTAKGGFRWCLLEIYVESTKAMCEAAGGTFVGRFPEIPLIETDNK